LLASVILYGQTLQDTYGIEGIMKFVDVYFSPMQLSNPATTSPSPRKPAYVVADWIEQKFPIRTVEPVPVTREQIALAHDRSYVDGVLDCLVPNGFRGRERDVADSLPWTTGSFLSAARCALGNGLVACSPTSGFHHAKYKSGFGYCTFNGLMVTALVLKEEGKVSRVGILDCDQHYGDGTAKIIDELAIGWIRHVSQEYCGAPAAKRFIDNLPDVVRGFTDCDLLMYQAGADQHIKDPLGGFLTTAELLERDLIVFSVAKEIGVPVVWNLAGGYQQPLANVLEIHRNTMAACVAEYVLNEHEVIAAQEKN
jgi:acetoin utilization deacetylase AcuC-like enzyme